MQTILLFRVDRDCEDSDRDTGYKSVAQDRSPSAEKELVTWPQAIIVVLVLGLSRSNCNKKPTVSEVMATLGCSQGPSSITDLWCNIPRSQPVIIWHLLMYILPPSYTLLASCNMRQIRHFQRLQLVSPQHKLSVFSDEKRRSSGPLTANFLRSLRLMEDEDHIETNHWKVTMCIFGYRW